MKVALFVLTQAIFLLALVAADDSDYSNGYSDSSSPQTSWIQWFFLWLSEFFYTTPPGELITNRPIQKNRYPSNSHLPNYPVQYVVPNEQQQANYAYANHIPSGPHITHSSYVDGVHGVANSHQNHVASYHYADTPGGKLQYPYFYKPRPSQQEHQPAHPNHRPHHQGDYQPSSHQSIVYEQPVGSSYSNPKKRRPWPLLTNAGKSPEQIEREAKELEGLIEQQRDRNHSKLSFDSLRP